jgi:hypothetical protein
VSAASVSLPAHARNLASATVNGAEVTHLRRLRWAVRSVLTLGVAASIAANVLHARPNLISQIIAAWPPLALLLTVELISRVPAHRRSLAVLRLLATAAIAGIAAWVSYWHMAGVAARYGETDAAASYLLPVSVDGLVVVASISLVEIAGRIRTSSTDPDLADTRTEKPAAGPDQPPLMQPPAGRVPAPPAGPRVAGGGEQLTAAAPTVDVVATGGPNRATSDRRSAPKADDADGDRQRHAVDDPGEAPSQEVADGPAVDAGPVHAETAPGLPAEAGPQKPDCETPSSNEDRAAEAAPRHDEQTKAPGGDATDGGHHHDDGADVDEGSVPSKTPAAVAFWYRRDPSMHPAEIAAKIGRSERTVRRYWPPTSQQAINGHEARRLADGLRAS